MAKPSDQEIKDMRDQPKLEEAYDKSLTNTPMAPMPKASAPVKKAKGGSVSSRADGIAQRGKTKGRMV